MNRQKRKIIFELKNVSVEFNRHFISKKSIKEIFNVEQVEAKSSSIIALDDVSLKISEGENVGLIGRNGAGKSTLLRVLSGVITPSGGRASRDSSMHLVPLLELGIGFQPDLSGRENCYLSGLLMGYSIKEIESRMKSIIEFSELEDFIDEPVKNYSSGMYARLAFAVATDIDPEILLVDEVFGVGDEFFMRKCIERMSALMKAGLTTVFVSHDLDFIKKQCSRVIWLEKGKIVLDGEPDEVIYKFRNQDYHLKLRIAN